MYYIYALLKGTKVGSFYDRLFYIGQTIDVKNRISRHVRDCRSNAIKAGIIDKYGLECVVLWVVDSQNEANEREEFLINYFGMICNNTGILSNMTNKADISNISRYSDEEKIYHINNFKKSNLNYTQYQEKYSIFRKTISKWVRSETILQHKKILIDPINKRKEIQEKFLNSGLSKREFEKKYNLSKETCYLNGVKCPLAKQRRDWKSVVDDFEKSGKNRTRFCKDIKCDFKDLTRNILIYKPYLLKLNKKSKNEQ